MKWKVIFIILSLFIAGCASVPLSTAVKFAGYSESDFATLSPEDIRVKIIVDDPLVIEPSSSKLSIDIDSQPGINTFEFALKTINVEAIPPQKGLLSNTVAKNETELALTDDSLEQFKEFQRELLRSGFQPKGFSVPFGFKDIKTFPDSTRVSVMLRLSKTAKFITLFDNYELNFKTD